MAERGEDVIVNVGLTHEGNSLFYDPQGNPHTFTHDPLPVGCSYELFSKSDSHDRLIKPEDSDEMVNYTAVRINDNTAYAVPSSFATWTFSLKISIWNAWISLVFIRAV